MLFEEISILIKSINVMEVFLACYMLSTDLDRWLFIPENLIIIGEGR